ncbi:MAG: sterol desaturase, partial [Flavobacterium sp.]
MAATDHNSKSKLTRDLSISLLIYSLPVVAIFLYFKLTNGLITESHITLPAFLEFAQPAFQHIRTWGLIVFMLVLGAIEFAAGLYDDEWTGEERKI